MPMRDDKFERLYAEHAQSLFGFLVYRCGNRPLAEDLVADTFERALRGRRLFDRRKGSEKTWLYAIALNCLRDQARREAAESRALERTQSLQAADGNVSSLAAVERHDDLYRALETLSDEEREAIALRFGSDLTVPEIARLKSEPLARVEGRVYRGLRKLRDRLLEPQEAETGDVASGMESLVRISG
jgi:RNA polymerase sigma factor (sigma-70 family)